jgi:hypothetical protein
MSFAWCSSTASCEEVEVLQAEIGPLTLRSDFLLVHPSAGTRGI